MREFEVTRTWRVEVPEVGTYDWNTYAREAYEMGLISYEEMETPEAAWAVAEAMVVDFMQREESCTAAQYVGIKSEPTPKEV